MRDFLQPLPYHRRVAACLATREPALWSWFTSAKAHAAHADRVRLDLLKTAYRLEPGAHPQPYAHARDAAEGLGVAAPLTIYQAQQSTGMNAALCWLPGEAHLLLSGPILARLAPEEVRAVFAHELAHFLLFEEFDREFLVADQVLGALARHPQAEPSHLRTACLYDLYQEVYADRAALQVTQDPAVTISSLVKIETGLEDVSAASYVRQAEEIFAREDAHTEGVTHPEAFIRARAVKLWAESPAEAHAAVVHMIEGPLRLDRLDLPGQERVTGLTRRLLRLLLAPPELRSDAMLAHARLFFDDFAPADPLDRDPHLKADLACDDPGLRDYFAYVLLDFVAADPTLEDSPLVAAFAVAEPLGLGDRLQELAARELKRKKKPLEKARKEGAAAAATTPSSAPTDDAPATDHAGGPPARPEEGGP